MSLAGFAAGRLPGAADRLGRVQERPLGSSARRARRRARTTGCRRATGTTRRTTTRAMASRTNVGRRVGASTASRAPATPCPRWTRSSGSCPPFEQTELWQNPDYNQYHANYERICPTPNERRLLVRHAARPRRGDQRTATAHGRASSQYVEEAQVQNYETQRAEFEAYIDHSTNAHGPVDRDRLLAAQQGLADPAVGPLQPRLRSGRQLLRGQEGQRAAARAVRATTTEPCRWTTSAAARAARAVGRGEGVRPRRHAAGRPDRERDLGWPARAWPQPPASGRSGRDPAAHPAQATSSSCSSRRHGQLVDRNVYWLSTQQDEVNWDETIGNPQATMTQYGDLDAAPEPAAAPPSRVTAHATRPGDGGRRHRDRGHDHEHLDRSRPWRSSCGPTSVAARAPAAPRGRRQPGPPDHVVRQRRDAVARRVRDAARHATGGARWPAPRRWSACPAGTWPRSTFAPGRSEQAHSVV